MKISQAELLEIIDRETRKQHEITMEFRELHDEIRRLREQMWETRSMIKKHIYGDPVQTPEVKTL